MLPPSPTLPEPVSQLQADFTLLDRGSGLRVEVFCQASSGSPPITYRLVRRSGHIHMQQTRNPGQPANFSFPLNQTADWFRCQAENDVSVQHTPFTLVPPGEMAPWFPEGQLALLSRSVGGAKSREGCPDAAMPTLARPNGSPAQLPPASFTGELPQGPTFVLAGCLISIIAIFSWRLSWTKQIR